MNNNFPTDIRKAYKLSWDNLMSKYSNGDLSGDNLRNLLNSKDKNAFDKLITQCIKPVIYSFIVNAYENKTVGFKIGRGIIQVNSLAANRRIKIPINGNIEGNDFEKWYGKGKNGIQKIWEDEYFCKTKNANDRSLMYLQPDRPNHLLTELIWRMQSKEVQDDNDVYAFVVFKESEKESKLQKIVKRGGNNFKSLTLKKSYINDEKTLNSLNSLISENPKVPLPRKYQEDDKKILLSSPHKILYKQAFGNVKVENIFYVSDINESDYLGAFDFELFAKGDDKISNAENLKKFIYNLRWLLSKFIIELIANFEKNFIISGDIYKALHFTENIDGNRTFSGLKKVIEILEPDDYLKENKYLIIVNILNKLRNHYNIADSDIGKYWRGYKRHAFETACTIAGIIEILFPKQKGLEGKVRSSGIGLENLNIDELPGFLKQLFVGLKREKELFLLPYYRDHFIHSFNCFCFGMILLVKSPEAIISGELAIKTMNKNEIEKIVKKWFIVAMGHDIAYVLQKGHGIIENYVLKFMKDIKRYKKVLPWTPSLGNLLQIEGLLDEIRNISEGSLSIKDKIEIKNNNDEIAFEIHESDLIIAVAFDEIDHGIWSGLFVNHAIQDMTQLNKKDRKDVARAIMTHHLSHWKIDDILGDFDKHRNLGENIKNNILINRGSNPLGYLLGICDMVCQFGREASEMAEDVPSNLEIKLSNIEYDEKDSILSVTLDYGNSKQSGSDLIKEYYIKPGNSLGLKAEGETNNTLKIIVSNQNYSGKDQKIDQKYFLIND